MISLHVVRLVLTNVIMTQPCLVTVPMKFQNVYTCNIRTWKFWQVFKYFDHKMTWKLGNRQKCIYPAFLLLSSHLFIILRKCKNLVLQFFPWNFTLIITLRMKSVGAVILMSVNVHTGRKYTYQNTYLLQLLEYSNKFFFIQYFTLYGTIN